MNKNIQITHIQIRGLMVTTMIGIGILTLPNTLARISGKDGWISIVLAGLVLIPFIIVINKIFERNPGKDFFQIGRETLGGIIFTIFLLFLAFYFVILIAFVARLLGEVIKAFLLPETPISVIVAMLLLPVLYISIYEINIIARMGYLIYPILLGFVILLIIIALPAAVFENILPQFKSDISKIPKGVMESLFSFGGFEILLFALPYAKDKKKAQKSTIIALIIVTSIYTVLFFLILTQFSIQQVKRQNFPLIMVAKMVDLPGFFLQNLDTVFMTVWVMVGFSTLGPTYYALGKTINDIFKQWKRMYIVLGLGPIIYIIAMLPRDALVLTNKMGKILNISTIISIIIIPLIIYIVGRIKEKVKG